jgi:ketosteroid isomerase-like protein
MILRFILTGIVKMLKFILRLNNEAVIELPAGNFYGDKNLVVEEGTYNFPDGKGGSVDKGKFIALWKQEDGKWKLYREIWNTDIPPAPAK